MIDVTYTVTTPDDLTGGTDVTDQLIEADGRVRLNEEGIGGMLVPYGETITPDPLGKVVVVRFDGTVAFSWLCRKQQTVEVADGEEARMVTEYSGPGLAALLGDYRCRPTLGADRSPWGKTRTFGPLSPEYDFSLWGPAVEYVEVQEPSSGWTGTPEGFPAGDAVWIGPGEGDDSGGPFGYWWTRTTLEMGENPGPVVFFYALDDFGPLVIDGFSIDVINTDRQPDAGYRTCHTATVYLSAGTHHIGSKIVNNLGVGDPGYGEGPTLEGNPTGFVCVGYRTDGAGRLLERIIQTGSDWELLAYPDDPPGMTDLEVIEVLVAEAVADGADHEFTVVGHGTFTPQESITVPTGGGLLEHLRDRADEGWIDWWVDPAALELHVWPGGTRGSASGVSFSTDDANLIQLQVTRIDNDVTGLWVGYSGGWTFVGAGGKVRSLETRAKTVGEAKALGELVLDRPTTPEQVTVDVAPLDGEVPGVDVLDGDTVTCGTYLERVIGWSFTWGDAFAGEPQFDLDLKDRIRGEEERIALMVQRAAPGQLGGTFPGAPGGEPPEFGTKVRASEVTFQPQNEPAGPSPAKVPSASGNMYAVAITATTPGSSDTVFDFLESGTPVISGGILPFGETFALIYLNPPVWVTGNLSTLQAEVTTYGTDVDGLLIEPRFV